MYRAKNRRKKDDHQVRDYQPKKSKYILPQGIYLSTLWIIRDYSRMKESIEDSILTSPSNDGMPKGTNVSDPTARKAMDLSDVVMKRIRAIEEARNDIPEEYMHGVWNNVQYRMPFPMDAARETYSRYKSKYIYKVAERLGLTRNL